MSRTMLFSVIFQDSTRSFTKGIVLKCTKYENPVFPKIVFESLRAFLHAPLQLVRTSWIQLRKTRADWVYWFCITDIDHYMHIQLFPTFWTPWQTYKYIHVAILTVEKEDFTSFSFRDLYFSDWVKIFERAVNGLRSVIIYKFILFSVFIAFSRSWYYFLGDLGFVSFWGFV